MMLRQVLLETARWRLAMMWFCAGGVLFSILVIQSLGGVYGDKVQTAWGWALPNFLPTLALMISVFAPDALLPYEEGGGQSVRSNFYKLSMGLSIFYLTILIMTLLAQPIVVTVRGASEISQIEIMEMSNLWLAPLQGLVVLSLGVLFFLKKKDDDALPNPSAFLGSRDKRDGMATQ